MIKIFHILIKKIARKAKGEVWAPLILDLGR